MNPIFVFSRELHIAVRDLTSPGDLFVNSLEVALQISLTVEGVGAEVATVWLYIGVLKDWKFWIFFFKPISIRTNLLLVMFPKYFLVKLLTATFIMTFVGRWLVVSHMEPQVLHAGILFPANFASDILVSVHMKDVLLQISVVEC